MARLFDSAQSEYLKLTGEPVSGFPLSFSVWIYPTSLVSNRVVAWYHDTGASKYLMRIRFLAATGQLLLYTDCGTARVISCGTVAVDTWYHLGVVLPDQNNRHMFVNGTKYSGTGDTGAAVSMEEMYIARNPAGTEYYHGRICEIGMWSSVITDAEMAKLARGTSPRYIQPSKRRAYWPLINAADDLDKDFDHRFDLTAYNTPTTATHQIIRYPMGTCTHSLERARTMPYCRHIYGWRSNVEGKARLTHMPVHLLRGKLMRLVTWPDGGNMAPTANYDVTLETDQGIDLLNGLGANRSATVSEATELYLAMEGAQSMRAEIGGHAPTLKVANAGMNRAGTIVLYCCEEGLVQPAIETPNESLSRFRQPVRPASQRPGGCCGSPQESPVPNPGVRNPSELPLLFSGANGRNLRPPCGPCRG